uniref:Dynein light chain n=1 Tax=Amphiprion ocellaris TaxID=80972 RepID=A0A3Q1AQE4_AMPOC
GILTKTLLLNGHLTQVEVDKMLLAIKLQSDHPPTPILILIYLFDIRGDVLLNIVLFHRLHGTVHCILLHFIRHICILDHRLLVRHVGVSAAGETKIIFRDIFHTVLPTQSQL